MNPADGSTLEARTTVEGSPQTTDGPTVTARLVIAMILGVTAGLVGLVLSAARGPSGGRPDTDLAFATLGLAGAVTWLAYRTLGRPPSTRRGVAVARRSAGDGAVLVLITIVLGLTVVLAWLAIGGTEVLQGPTRTARTSGLVVTALLASFAAAAGAAVGRFRSKRMTTEGLVALGFAAWVGELLVLFVVGPFIADELGRGVGVVVTVWVMATAGVVQPLAFVAGGLAGRHIRSDLREHPPIVTDLPPDDRFRNGFVVHEHTDVPDFPLLADFAVEAGWTEAFGAHMVWSSASLGPLTWFPWWDHLELDDRLMDPEHPPLGTWEDPFYDGDQSWELYAWDDGEHVFVATGDDFGQIDGAYRVPRERFMTAWRDGVAAIRAMRPAGRTDGRS